ncbi:MULTISPECIES: hypothetical protein [unclassified Azospirillum]|uniref:hypothetical protein n=1 Tax=unclassified Azospirillum TaxID=2630922 RepID=UPI000B7064DA|nr:MULTISPECIES: hypothetical protein [unclassified Azospirillum]SNS67426.1 hypothetical protein SAMN05880556_10967 [Azospirillum sp. RU38E]SNS85692.1 hypothetical protein SAMN05880591_10967 [Azospirillum sp. RU37A]
MSIYRAFGDAAKRTALIADIRGKGPIYQAWLTRASVEGDISALSDEYGLHPAMARLLPALGAFGEAEDAAGFYESLLNAIPVGAETGALARQSLLLAWNDPVYGRANIIKPGPLRAACEGVIALVTRSIDQPVDKKAWRAARTALVTARSEDTSADRAVDLVMSLAWDLEQAPGAAHDVITAWSAAVNIEADASDEDCFSDAENETFQTEMNKINEEAMEALSEKQSLDSIGVEEFLAEVERLWAADPARHALKQRSMARRTRSNAKMAAWRAAIQQQVLDLATAAFRSPNASLSGVQPVHSLT